MDYIYNKYCLEPKLKDAVSPITPTIYDYKKQGETFWSLDCETIETIDEYFKIFYNTYISNYENLAVDGPAACGKSSLLAKLKPTKINKFYNINDANIYNTIPEMSLTYIKINEELSKYKGLTTDRSSISNIAYLMTYYIMNMITNDGLYNKSLHSVCHEFMNFNNLFSLLQNIRSKKMNTLIVLDSSFEHVAKRMNKRGLDQKSPSDVVKSLCKEYHTAQIAAFSYLANYMNYPCIDLNYVRLAFSVTDETLLFKANTNAFKNCCYFEPFNKIINVPRERTTLNSDTLKWVHNNAIQISKR